MDSVNKKNKRIMNTAKKLTVLFVTAMAVQMLASCGGTALSAIYQEQYNRAKLEQQQSGGDSDMKAQ